MMLLTGGSGLLGTELQKYLNCYAPSREKLDITKRMVRDKAVDRVVHCAAYTNVIEAEKNKKECFNVNVFGVQNMTYNYKDFTFVYISSEYAGNPMNFYSWTKAWAEEIVRQHPNSLIIRTSFVPRPFPHKYAFADQYTQGDYVDVIAPMIAKEVMKGTKGEIYIGTGKKTMFELARQTKPKIKGISVDDIKSVKLPKDYL